MPFTNAGYTDIVPRANHRKGRQDLPLSFLYILTRSDASAPGCFFVPDLFLPAVPFPGNAENRFRTGAWPPGLKKRRYYRNVSLCVHIPVTDAGYTVIVPRENHRTEDRIFHHPSFICNPERCQRSGLFLFPGPFSSRGILSGTRAIACAFRKAHKYYRNVSHCVHMPVTNDDYTVIVPRENHRTEDEFFHHPSFIF